MYTERDEHIIHIGAGTIVKTIVILLLFAMLFFLKDLILVILMSILIASSIEPGTQWFVRRKVPRLLSIIVIYLGMFLFMVGVIYFLLIPLLGESTSFLQNIPTYFSSDTVSNTLETNNFISSQPFVAGLRDSINIDQVIGQINTLITSFSSGAFNTVSSIFGGILSFLLMIVMSFYLAVEEDGVGKFLKIVTPLKHEKYVINLWGRAQKKIGLWMQGQIILAVIVGMLVYLGLTLMGVPNALLLAFLAGVFEIIPLFGPILASIPAIAIAFVAGQIPLALLVVGLYIIVHQFENQLIYPLVVKKVVGVSPIVSIVALIAGYQLAGFLGLILSVPIAAVMMEFFNDLERDKIEAMEKILNSEK
jgi:predicted PurR-regulated permease PerM